ncbi:toll/interleukin-1 receptor domain-containing protein [Bacillus sp. FSL W8-0116]|uniref:toll/interleukin-1 receptor domain-containing protein n=1 Tax=Bacillus sp. FSL W8-0116 TaxID=2978206 RepID=UPI0030F7778F
MENNKIIFLSYSWANDKCADLLDENLSSFEGIEIKRDRREIDYSQDIEEFMKTIRKTDHAILLISDDYLKSTNCMFEVSQIIKDDEYINKITPIIIGDTSIYRVEDRLKYAKYWNDKYNFLNKEIRDLNIEDNISLIQELKKVKIICSAIDEILSVLNRKQYYNFEKHFQNEFNDIFKSLNLEKAPRKKAYAVVENKEESFDYTIYKLKDLSTAGAKRYSASIILNEKYTKEQIKKLISFVTKEVKNEKYQRNNKVKNRHSNKVADVVWLFIANDLFDVQTTNWICRTSWISDTLDVQFKPLPLRGNDIIEDIQIEWNESYESLKSFYKNNQGNKGELLETLDKLSSEMQNYGEKVINNFEKYKNSKITEEEFINRMQSMERDVKELYFEFNNIPLPTEDIRNFKSLCGELFSVIDNMFLFYSKKGIDTWDSKSREWQISKSIEEFNKLVPVVKYERDKIN